MARGKRGGAGGYQKPARPAAVSGPGALSARTDGNVPAPPVTGLPYGQNQALTEQQGAAPMTAPPAGSGGAGGGGMGPRPAGPPGMGPDGAFSPTGRPGEPLTAGIDWGQGPGAPKSALPDEPYMVAKALYALSPTPELERLIARLARA